MKTLIRILTIMVICFFLSLQTNIVKAGSYNRSKAATYADKYWNTRNPAYGYYTNNNCSNFASQCLIAGGLSLKNGPGLDKWGAIPACDNLHLHLKNSQKATYIRKTSGYPSWFTQGDIIIFGNSSDRWKHAAVNATTGTPNLDANTNNRYHVSVSFFYPGSSFTSADFYHINSTSVTTPANDNCSGAKQIVPNGNMLTGTVQGATSSYGANKCTGCGCASPDDKDVYYYFKATGTSHTVKLSGYASNFDAVIELRTACGYNTAISCYDPVGCPTSVSHTWSNLKVGYTYYIRVFEYDNTGTPPKSPTFNINVTGGSSLKSVSASAMQMGKNTEGSFDAETGQKLSGTQIDSKPAGKGSNVGSDNPKTSKKTSFTVQSEATSATNNEKDLEGTKEDNNSAQVSVSKTSRIKELSFKEKIKLFPNPVDNILNFETDNSVIIKNVIITSQTGQLIRVVENPSNQIDVSNLSSGIYFIKFLNDNNQEAVFRIIKR